MTAPDLTKLTVSELLAHVRSGAPFDYLDELARRALANDALRSHADTCPECDGSGTVVRLARRAREAVPEGVQDPSPAPDLLAVVRAAAKVAAHPRWERSEDHGLAKALAKLGGGVKNGKTQ